MKVNANYERNIKVGDHITIQIQHGWSGFWICGVLVNEMEEDCDLNQGLWPLPYIEQSDFDFNDKDFGKKGRSGKELFDRDVSESNAVAYLRDVLAEEYHNYSFPLGITFALPFWHYYYEEALAIAGKLGNAKVTDEVSLKEKQNENV